MDIPKPLFHIIRLKENRFKVVWIKNKHEQHNENIENNENN